MLDVKKIFKTCHWENVPIVEMGNGYLKIYRKKVHEKDLLNYAKSKLMEAYSLACEGNSRKLSDSQKTLSVEELVNKMYRNVHCFEYSQEIAWRVENFTAIFIACMVYIYGIDFYNELINK
jgi:hypothetical protein